MDKLIKSTLLSSISAGGRIKAPRQPNIWCGESKNGYTPGDLVDANGLVDFIIENDVIHDDPEFLRLKAQIEQEVVDRTAAMVAMREYINQLIQELIGASTPEALDTLAEIAEVLLNDPDIINEILARLNTIETTYATIAQLEDTELVTSAALNDLNDRVDLLETSNMTEITYADLVTLRDNSQLIKGHLYRITDYVTTTAQEDTLSAGHAFDIVVVALDESHLCEKAFATPHTGDTYFANCKMEAWELKYCLDNDTTKYAWADTTNGKGVIWWMKDEWNNECPYDFKNIQFKRYKITSSPQNTDLEGQYSRNGVSGIIVDTQNPYWCYTFSMIDTSDDVAHDVSVEQDTYYNDEGYCSKTRNNILRPYTTSVYVDDLDATFELSLLPDNVFVTDTDICVIDDDYGEFYGFYCNILGNRCRRNTFGSGFFFNTFGSNCSDNTFGSNCSDNTSGNDFQNNTFGSGCSNNTFGNSCGYNTFGTEYYYNIFGSNCDHNTFGYTCQNNTFGNDCNGNTFGNSCYYNTFVHECIANTFGSGCSNNTFGNGCSYIKFGTSGTTKSYYRYIVIENGNRFIYLDTSATTSDSNPLRNVKIAQGVNNTNTYKTITHATVNDTFQTVYKPANSVEVSV